MKRSSFPNRGRAKIFLLGGLSLVALLGTGTTTAGHKLIAQIGIGDSFAKTTEAAERLVENGSNAVQAFLGRSPGERGAADIIKGKAKRALAKDDAPIGKPKPTQRALGKTFDDPLLSLAGPLTSAPGVEFLPVDAAPAAASIPALALTVPGGSGGFTPVGGGSIGGGVGGGSGGGGGGGDGIVPPPPALPPVAAVPEPSTWTLLLIGFAAVGASIRRSKKAGKLSGPDRAGNCVTA
ncbi:PEPxxWA-CTERM sorting domain-containing protein [Sphingorhabdus sp.]|uniref:PEPxxWA-CTERM sorting domain-containing protein n=1 Tax=Sphingorhabdus sp. TaxID=1902408 RepID=UPI003983588C